MRKWAAGADNCGVATGEQVWKTGGKVQRHLVDRWRIARPGEECGTEGRDRQKGQGKHMTEAEIITVRTFMLWSYCIRNYLLDNF